MDIAKQNLNSLSITDLNLYMELGNKASEFGDVEKSFKWYQKGLSKARELQNKEKVSEFSILLSMLL